MDYDHRSHWKAILPLYNLQDSNSTNEHMKTYSISCHQGNEIKLVIKYHYILHIISHQGYEIKIMIKYHCIPFKMQNFQNWYQILVRIWSNNNSHSLLMEMQNGISPLKDSLVVSYKIKRIHIIKPSSYTPYYIPKRVKVLSVNHRSHMDVYINFIHNCQNLETTKMPISRWLDKLIYLKNGLFVVLKRN